MNRLQRAAHKILTDAGYTPTADRVNLVAAILPGAKQVLRDFVDERLDDGVDCPVCEKWCKRYKRKLNSSMARWLIELVKLSGSERKFVHAKSVFRRLGDRGNEASDYPILRHWGLTEADPDAEKGDGRKPGMAGYWRPTDLGVDFVHNRVTVSRQIVLFNRNHEGFAGGDINIVDALGDRFNYGEMMAS